jgi:uncharacterized membrane protein YeaQ/YmgE (transglycosylase-associated protein family)
MFVILFTDSLRPMCSIVTDWTLIRDLAFPEADLSPRGSKEVKAMLGMSFVSFAVLLIIGAVVAVAYHSIVRYRFLEGNDALFGKLIVGWFGAWLGSPVLGHWLWRIESVYIVPAILGAIAAIHLNILLWRALAKLAGMRLTAIAEVKPEIRPVKPAAAA